MNGERWRHLRPAMGMALRATLVAVAALAASASAAPQTCAPTRLEVPNPTPQGQCSIASMLAGVSGSDFPIGYRSLSGGKAVPPADSPRWQARSAGFREAPFPGQGWLRLSGLLDSQGTTCNHHVQAITAKRGEADPITSGKLKALPEALRQRVEAAKKRLNRERGAGPTDTSRSILFEVFSPQAGLKELGVEDSIPAALDGSGQGTIAGWPAGSYATFTIALPGVQPADLRAGGTYPAEVRGVDPQLLRQWQGKIHAFRRSRKGPHQAMAQRICQRGLEAVASKWQHYPSVVSDAQDRGCNESRIFTGTRRKLIARQLTGTVSVVDIHDGRIRARFELAGQGRVEIGRYHLTRAESPKGDIMGEPDPTDEHLKQVRRESVREGPVHIKGYLRAPNRIADQRLSPNYRPRGGAQPMLDAHTVIVPTDTGNDEVDPLRPEPSFGIASHQPARDRRNVHWDKPGIRVAFNRPIDPATVTNGAVRVATGSTQGNMVAARAQVRLAGEQAVRVAIPRGLKDGVHYRVTVNAGPSGISSRQGQRLDQDYRWRFATMVDLDRSQKIYATGNHLTGQRGIEPHVFQAARDAELVAGKNTLTRVYVKWRGHPNIAPRWQVRHFDADVAVEGTRRLYQAKIGVRLQRPDQWTATQRVHAETSVNFHGWFPQRADGDELFATVEPVDQCVAEPRVFRSDPLDLTYTPRSPSLDLDYYIVRAGDWGGDALTGGDQQWVPGTAHTIATSGARFTTQNFPVVDTRLTYRGTIAVGDKSWRQAANDLLNRQPRDQRLIERLRPRLNREAGDADAVVLFMGSDIRADGGYAYQEATAAQPGIVGVFLDDERFQPIRKGVVDFAHELGHVMMADDRHYDRGAWTSAYETTRENQIEGFRLPRVGHGGRNKSHAEGNASPNGSRLYPLMMAGQMLVGASFVTNDSYDDLIEALTHPPSRLAGRGGPLRLAARDADATPAMRPVWTVHGMVDAARQEAAFTRVDATRGTTRNADSTQGHWRLALTDDAGTILATTAIEPQAALKPNAASSARRFTATLARTDKADALIIRHQDRTIARRALSPNAPQLDVAPPRIRDERIRLTWQARDPDRHNELRFDIAYSRDGGRFRPLAVGLADTAVNVASAELAPGPDPRLRVTVSDGFHTRERSVSAPETGRLRALATLPAAGASMTPWQPITAVFNAPLAQASIDSHALRVLDADKQSVPGRLDHQRGTGRIDFIPNEPLQPGRYTAVLAPSISATHGSSLSDAVRWRFEVANDRRPIERGDANDAR